MWYPCDFYCVDEWKLGNINEANFVILAQEQSRLGFIKRSLKLKTRCLKCEFSSLCKGGGCYREKQSVNYCEAYKHFFKHNIHKFKVFDCLKK